MICAGILVYITSSNGSNTEVEIIVLLLLS